MFSVVCHSLLTTFSIWSHSCTDPAQTWYTGIFMYTKCCSNWSSNYILLIGHICGNGSKKPQTWTRLREFNFNDSDRRLSATCHRVSKGFFVTAELIVCTSWRHAYTYIYIYIYLTDTLFVCKSLQRFMTPTLVCVVSHTRRLYIVATIRWDFAEGEKQRPSYFTSCSHVTSSGWAGASDLQSVAEEDDDDDDGRSREWDSQSVRRLMKQVVYGTGRPVTTPDEVDKMRERAAAVSVSEEDDR